MDDPGLNVAAGKAWTSSTWTYQTDREFWAQNSPLYPAGLSVWARVFGSSMVASRAYCYFLGTVGLFFLWLGSYRLNLLTPGYRLFWLLFLATEYGMNWMMRNARYDVWIFLGLSLAWTGTSLKRPAAQVWADLHGLLSRALGRVRKPDLHLPAGRTGDHAHRISRMEGGRGRGDRGGRWDALRIGFYALMGVAGSFWRVVQGSSVAGTSVRFRAVLEVFSVSQGRLRHHPPDRRAGSADHAVSSSQACGLCSLAGAGLGDDPLDALHYAGARRFHEHIPLHGDHPPLAGRPGVGGSSGAGECRPRDHPGRGTSLFERPPVTDVFRLQGMGLPGPEAY